VNILVRVKSQVDSLTLPLMPYFAVYADIKYNIYVVCSSELVINLTLVKALIIPTMLILRCIKDWISTV